MMKRQIQILTNPLANLFAAFRRRGPVNPMLLVLVGALVLAGCDSGGAMEPDGDTTPPQVVRAEATSATQIAVIFDEPLDPTSVTAQPSPSAMV